MKTRLLRASCYRQKQEFNLALEDVETASKYFEQRIISDKKKKNENRSNLLELKEQKKLTEDEIVMEPLPIVRQRNLIVSDIIYLYCMIVV